MIRSCIHISGTNLSYRKVEGWFSGFSESRGLRILVLLFHGFILLPGLSPAQNTDPDSLSFILIEAIEREDIKMVKSLIRKDVDVNHAVSRKNECYNFEIRPPGYLDQTGIFTLWHCKVTPLHANSAHPNQEILQLLLKAGAKVNTPDPFGRTPLMYALNHPNGERQTLQLLQAGANYTTRDKRNNSTLHYAAQGGNLESIRLTASGGVDLNTQNEDGMTPLHVAAITAKREVLAAFVDLGASLSKKDARGRTLLHYAAGNGHREEVKYLYQLSPSLFAESKEGTNPLDIAYWSGNTEVALFFRRQGHEFSDFHYSDLMVAVKRADADAVLKHLMAGANPNRKPKADSDNGSGSEPSSGSSGSEPSSGNPNSAPSPNNEKKTYRPYSYPIHIAATNGDKASLRHLLRFGAKLDKADPEGRTALAIALEEGHPECASFLIEQGARPASKWLPVLTWNLRDAKFRARWSQVIPQIATKVEDIDIAGGELKMPALHYAAYLGLDELVQQLLDAGANAVKTDQQGWTPLHWAVIKREIIANIPEKVRIAELLIRKGVSLNSRTDLPKELPHRQPYLARRVPGNASPIDLLDYALPKDSNMMALLDTNGSQPSMLAADFFENGTELLKLKLYDAAQVEFNKCLKREPEFAEAYYYRGKSKQALSMPESAAIDFGQAIQYRPFYPEAWFEAGKTRLDLKQYPEAEINLSKALSQGVRTGEIHYLLGVSKLKQDRVEEACQDFSQAANQNHSTAKEAIELYCK